MKLRTINFSLRAIWASLVAQTVKRLPAMRETQVRSLGRKIVWRRKWQPTPVFLPGKSHGWSLVGYSPWGRKESDMTERLHSLTLRGYRYLPWASLVAQTVKRRPAMWDTQVQSLGREDAQEKDMTTHSSTLAWKIPWNEEPGRLQSHGVAKSRT